LSTEARSAKVDVTQELRRGPSLIMMIS